jgi:hypothetical protein
VNISSSLIAVTIVGISPNPAPGTAPTGAFTFSSKLDDGLGYQFNVKTTKYPAPKTYVVSFRAGSDPTVHQASFALQ